jgi:hypothetical protein
MYIEKEQMRAHEYIKTTRQYLDYLEEHIENIRKAFCELSDKCRDMWWVSDDYQWHTFREEVVWHDISKFSKEEFIQYKDSFYPVSDKDKENSDFDRAWENHKKKNSHHHETVYNYNDVIHMVIDWTAMGYKFGDTAQEYYESKRENIKLSDEHKKFMYEIFERL